MPDKLTLIHPAIGDEEVGAVKSLLEDRDAVPNIAYMSMPGGPIDTLTLEFARFIAEGANPQDPFFKRWSSASGTGDLKILAGGFSNATGALVSLMLAHGVDGGEVIATSLNYAGVVNAIALAGATPRFVDVDPASFCMDPSSLEGAITGKTRAVILTHMNRFVDLEPFHDVLEKRGAGIPVIQDASLAVGSTLRGFRPGLINIGEGGATVFSLATSKIMSGLGGALVTCSEVELLTRATSIAYQGLDLKSADLLDNQGANFKMNDMNAVIAREQLRKRDRLFARRRELAGAYGDLLRDAVSDGRVVLQDVGDEAVLTHYAVLVEGRGELAKRLYDKHGIPLGIWHIHHRQKPYEEFATKLPVTDSLEDRIAFLPFHTELSEDDVRFVSEKLLEEMR